MVHSVMATPTVSKTKRDGQHSAHSGAKDGDGNKLFAEILEEAAQKPQPAPRACQTTLYDRDSRLQNFNYLTREYHY